MARIPAIALLASFLLGLTGAYPIEQFMRLRLRRQAHAWIRSGVRDRDVVTFTFQLQDGVIADPRFTWEEEDEFSLDDEWFDVVDQKVVDGAVVIRCVRDGKEERLIARFTALHGNAVPSDRQGAQVLVHLLTQRCLPQTRTMRPESPAPLPHSFAMERSEALSDRRSIPPSPPPERLAA